jgi:N-acetylneuraminic acid mutarotase
MSRRSSPWVLTALIASLLACSRAPEGSSSAPDAAVGSAAAPLTIASPESRAVLAALRRHPLLAKHLPGARPAIKTVGTWSLAAPRVSVRLPANASEPLHLALEARPDAFLEIYADGAAADSRAEALEGATVFNEALRDTDLVHVVEPTVVEELRLLRTADASTTSRWTVRLGAGLSELRAKGSVIEVLDRGGHIVFATEPLFAVDAREVRRDLDVKVAGEGNAYTITATLDAKELELPIAIDPVWTTTAAMANARSNAAAVKLASETILIAGGNATSGVTNTVEEYAPSTGLWTTKTAMGMARYGHQAILLTDGRVLVAGGRAGSGPASSAEIFNPSTGTWSTSSASSHADGIVVRLDDGKVVAAGGQDFSGGYTVATHVYDPAAGYWSYVGDMSSGRKFATGTLLSSGRVLVAGGMSSGGGAMASVELFEPSGTWTSSKPLSLPRSNHAAVAMDSGEVLVIGGQGGSSSVARSECELYDPSTDTWTTTASMATGRIRPAAVLLATGRVLVAGGQDGSGNALSSAEIYDPATASWSSAGFMSIARTNAMSTIVAFGTNKALIAGGDNSGTRLSTVEIFADGAADGTTCSFDSACASSHCSDGYCCDAACTDQCEACDISGSLGKCRAVSGAPHGSRTSCIGSGVCEAQCNGSNRTACGTPPGSSTLCAAATCSGGLATPARYCDGMGVCNPPLSTDCGAYTCGTTACRTSCTTNAECASGYTCIGSVCKTGGGLGTACGAGADCASGNCVDNVCCSTASCASPLKCNANGLGTCSKPLGAACTTGTECGSEYCVDGVCCDQACTGQCEACSVTPGSCLPRVGAPVGTRTACSGTGACTATCDGNDTTACRNVPGSSTACATATCSAGIATPTRYCDGTGNCSAGTSSSCGAYACGSTACLTSCSSDSNCATGYFCSAGACIAKLALGAACSLGTMCNSGNCVDGACCSTSSCTAPATCNANGVGTCSRALGVACSVGTQCSSAKCVDGVCCNSTCTGQCEACDVGGSLGTCSAVVGLPHGSRTICSGTGACQAQCNGSLRTACGTPPGSSTVCLAATCTSGSATPTRYCDGAGTCSAAGSTSCGAYTCGSAACRTSCTPSTGATDCASGYFCSGTTCTTTGGAGTVCTSGTQCSSGYCVDGACCTVSSCTAPLKCNAKGDGTCSKPNGTACTVGSECGSNNCVDGVCCNSPCGGQCEACDVGGSAGTCLPVVGAPHAARTSCTGTGTCKAQCDGSNRIACGAPPGTSTVCAAASCTAGMATPTSYCNGIGACSPETASSCGAYVCGGSACKSNCTSISDCASGFFCSAASCVPKLANGAACTLGTMCTSGSCVDGVCCSSSSCASGLKCNAKGDGTCSKPLGVTCAADTECGSGKCVDGLCCDSACTGQCEACDVGGNLGKCMAVVGTVHGTRTACTGSGTCQATCNGSDRLSCGAVPGTSTICAAASCTGGAATPASFCNGLGACATATSSSCGAYLCGTTTCRSTCTTSADCATGYGCKDGRCVTTGALGTICSDNTQCKSGFCAPSGPGGNVCCSVATCAAGSICGDATAKNPGTCVRADGQSCATSDECKSGYCVDGVCCESGCTGQCEACDVPGGLGKCTGVSGEPHGVRAKCDAGGTDVCKALACDSSKDRSKCVGFLNGPSKECAAAQCEGGRATPAAFCDGAGTCKVGTTVTCGAYACGEKACKDKCSADTDCGNGFICDAAKSECVPAQETCTADGLSSQSADKSTTRSCAPFRCNPTSGGCFGACTLTEQCAPGSVCNGTTCVSNAGGPVEDGGGCAFGGSSRAPFGALTVTAGLALLLGRRRRRQSALKL